jgi:hypothetical protein
MAALRESGPSPPTIFSQLLAQWATVFRPSGAWREFDSNILPTACAVGYGLSPLRGLQGIRLEYFTHRLRSGLARFNGTGYAGYDAERVTQFLP